MMRILLFLGTNLAVILVASITLRLLGVDAYLSENGMNMTGLLIFCFIFGMAVDGLAVHLQVDGQALHRHRGHRDASNATEKWLLDTVAELARDAGIKTPEVGIFPAQQSNAFATGWKKDDASWPFPPACSTA